MKFRIALSLLCIALVVGCSGQSLKTSPPATSPQVAERRVAEAEAQEQTNEAPDNQLEDSRQPELTIAPLPDIKLGSRPPITPQRTATIRGWISRLATIDGPDYGISGSMTGTAFLPAPNGGNFDMGVMTDHQLKSSPDLKLLVENGIDTLSFLLDSLDDKTPTKYTIGDGTAFGNMSLQHEIHGNPMNKLECEVLKASEKKKDEGLGDTSIKQHVLTIGDVCFVAIGQIVGRRYLAVRYQPTANVYINSPTADPLLCEQVRKIWKSDNSAKKLFNSLLLDYLTRGAPSNAELSNWSYGEHFQCEAAMRLLFYFPEECADLIAERVRSLDVKKTLDHPGENDAYQKRFFRNGVEANEFLKGLAWSKSTKVKQAIQDIFERTDDEWILIATLPAMQESREDAAFDKLIEFLKSAPNDNEDGLGFDCLLMQNLIATYGERAKPVMGQMLTNASASRANNFIEAIQVAKAPWADQILLQLLDDKRPAPGFTYRVCDAAALAIHRNDASRKFEWKDKIVERDQQIDAMKALMRKM